MVANQRAKKFPHTMTVKLDTPTNNKVEIIVKEKEKRGKPIDKATFGRKCIQFGANNPNIILKD